MKALIKTLIFDGLHAGDPLPEKIGVRRAGKASGPELAVPLIWRLRLAAASRTLRCAAKD
jgi:hypothetical protein